MRFFFGHLLASVKRLGKCGSAPSRRRSFRPGVESLEARSLRRTRPFNLPVNTAVGPGPLSVAAGDLNFDGRPDLVVGNFSSTSLSVLLNNGTGGFTSSSLTVGANPSGEVIGDFDGDFTPD